MSLFTDKMYVSLLSPRLERFQKKSDTLWNFRCPICGDSQKNKFKARGYIYQRKHELRFSCKNCGAGMSFSHFLKAVDRILYSQYQMTLFEESGQASKNESSELEEALRNQPKMVFKKTKQIDLPTIDSLAYNHYGKRYIIDRKLPKERLSELYWAQDFKAFIQDIYPDYDKLESLHENEPRVVIPFYSEDGEILLGVQGRSMDPKSKVKYITIKMTHDNMKVYGLNKMNRRKKVYVLEGPFDAMFLHNAIATMDPTLYSVIPLLGALDYTFVFDNQPRNKDIVKLMDKTISLGHDICIWPKGIPQKDVNEMIKDGGMSSAQVQDMIDRHTVSDLEASLKLAEWRKI